MRIMCPIIFWARKSSILRKIPRYDRQLDTDISGKAPMSNKVCLFFTSDLMFSSRVKPVAEEAGFDLRYPGFEESSFDSPIDLVIFDLGYVSGTDITETLDRLKNIGHPLPKTVAYGPHVKKELLETAHQAGVDLVWTRGQFNQQFSVLFAN